MPLHFTRTGVQALAEEEQRQLREMFEHRHCLRFDSFFEPSLLAWLQHRIRSARFVTRVHDALTPPARDTALADARLQSTLFLLMNDSRLFSAVESITGCESIGSFAPVVMRQDPGDHHHDSWHSDVDRNRMVALSVNVGERFAGSALQLRDRETARLLHSDSNAHPGSALLFRISPQLQHRVAPLEGARSRTVLVGWFQRQPVVTSTRIFT